MWTTWRPLVPSPCPATITSVDFLSIFIAPKRNPFGPIRNPAATDLCPAPKDLPVLDSLLSGATRRAVGVRLPSRGTHRVTRAVRCQACSATDHAGDRRRRSSLVDAWRLHHVAAGLTRRLAGRLWAAREVGRDGDGRRPQGSLKGNRAGAPTSAVGRGRLSKSANREGSSRTGHRVEAGQGRRKAPAFQENRNILTSVNPHKSNMKISYEVSQNEGF